MKKFGELNIENNHKSMVGEKMKMAKVLNRQIIVHSFRVEKSKYPKNKSGMCLYLQIEIEGVKWVIFTGSDVLLEQIEQVDINDFPFITTIQKNNEYFEFT
jgi:hypothetical protein